MNKRKPIRIDTACGKMSEIRIVLDDIDCECCGNTTFQLYPENSLDLYEPEQACHLVCSGCMETLYMPVNEDDS